MTANQLL